MLHLQAVSEATGIPAAKLSRSDAAALSHLESDLSAQVVGQTQAVAGAARAVRLWRSGLLGSTSERPAVSLLLTGPAGVGKRTLCKVGGLQPGAPACCHWGEMRCRFDSIAQWGCRLSGLARRLSIGGWLINVCCM
jgi:hypothetical protein